MVASLLRHICVTRLQWVKNFLIDENASEYVVYKMATILSQPQSVTYAEIKCEQNPNREWLYRINS